MPTNNPYQAPNADISQGSDNTPYQPKVFAVHGRIGRLRYLAYGFLSMLISLPIFAIVAAVGVPASTEEGPGALGGIALALMVVVYIALIVYSFIIAKRRFNDINQTGWLSLLMLVPLVNFIVALILIFMPGTKTGNKYGQPPAANNIWVYLGSLIFPIFMIGVLAAVAIPAYQDYVERAQQYETMYQE